MTAKSASPEISVNKGATITLPSDREIRLVRLFNAPRHLVFEAWTKPEHVKHWWDPCGRPLAICEIDLRPRGTFRFVNSTPEGPATRLPEPTVRSHLQCGSYSGRPTRVGLTLSARLSSRSERVRRYLL